MRWWPALAALLVLAAGCGQAPARSTASADVQGGGSGSTTAPTSGPGSPTPTHPTPNEANGSAAATTWYLHKARTCDGGTGSLCNCGSYRNYLVQEARKDTCDGGGARGPGATGCDVECFPADQPFPAYPRGAKVAGSVFLTDDAADQMQVTLSLTLNGTAIGSATQSATIVGTGGGTSQEVPFTFTLEQAIPAGLETGKMAFRVHVVARESWFLAADPTSHFTVG